MKKETRKNNLRNLAILSFVLLVALVLRLYKINIPLADFHSWRQADTAAVARNFEKTGFNLLSPRYDDLSNIQSGMENPEGLRFVEFPLYNATFGFLHKTLPIISLEEYGRIVTVIFSLIIIAIIYYFLLREVGGIAAFAGSLVYATMPFFVYFSRVVLPETMAVATTFGALFFLYLFASSKNKRINFIYYALSIILFAVSLLIKPTVIFFSLSFLYLFYRKYGMTMFRQITLYLFFVLSGAPLLLWRNYISAYPQGVPFSSWLITEVNTPNGREVIFLKPAFFRWIFYERINNIILGGYLTVFFVLGALARHKKYFLYSILVSSLLFVFVFEGGNVQHEYYQTLILPALAIFTGIGISFINKNYKSFISPAVAASIIILIYLFSFFISYKQVKGYYGYSGELVSMASVIRDLTDPNDKIITDTIGDTTLLYLSDRKGSPAPFKSFSDFKKQGYKYFVSQNAGSIESAKNNSELELVFESEKFAIFHL